MTPYSEARRAMILTLSFDVASAFVAMFIAVSMRWIATDGAPGGELMPTAVAMSLIFACAAFVAFFSLGVHRQVWRHAGWPDAVRIFQAVALSALIFLPILFLINRLVGFPRSSLPISVMIWLVILFAGRMAALSRSTQRPFQIFENARSDAPAAVLVASAHEAAEVLRDLRNSQEGAPVRILGLLEAEGAEPGRAIRGVPVLGGIDDLGKILDLLSVRYKSTPWIAVAGATRRREVMNDILELGATRKTRVMALGTGAEGLHLQRVRPADLLERPERRLDDRPVRSLLEGKRIFLTGAGGSIGSELALQCAAHGAAHLTLFDASEYNLYSIDLLLRERYPDITRTAVLGDVRDANRLHQTMEEAEPEIVVHAAALKHVPLMELNPCEAVMTNVAGTVNTVDTAIALGVKRFVFISTDKAVDPDNVMGATKRLAELALAYRAKGTDLAVSMVRFGNVLGSSGSVVPLFERQIASGGPITLTHEDVTRYFMTVEEATSLVLQGAANNGVPGHASLYVLDMNEPIRIRDLAEAMVRMKGMVPGRDIEIETTGLRPGEKLHERLTYDSERLLETGISGLHKVTPDKRDNEPRGFRTALNKLLKEASGRNGDETLEMLSGLVPAYRPPNGTQE